MPTEKSEKKRVLLCNEAGFLATGYSTYGRELLERLAATGKYELAELAAYAKPEDPRVHGYRSIVPWQVFCNEPAEGTEERELFNRGNNNSFVFGGFSFERVCLQFKPDVVISFRDVWMDDFIQNSPFRKFYRWVYMPTVDAYPQKDEWLATFLDADGVLTYQEWSQNLLKKLGNNKIKLYGDAPAGPNVNYQPLPPEQVKRLKNSLGFGDDIKIVGTIMRNQPRKLYPQLFKDFRAFLDSGDYDNIYLYCHTSYPDSWDIPGLLKEYNLSNNVLFTYVCEASDCRNVEHQLFSDARTVCSRCKRDTLGMANANRGCPEIVLNAIMNIFDVYVQYANSEGLGMPMIEAAAAGIPIMAVDYSAMSDVVRKLNGFPIKVKALTKEHNTGCMRAIPDGEHFVELLTDFFKKPAAIRAQYKVKAKLGCEKHYNYDFAAIKWMNAIDSMMPAENWNSPPKFRFPQEFNEHPQVDNEKYARWLITNVLCDPRQINSYNELKLVRNLNWQVALGGNNMGHVEDSIFGKQHFEKIDRKKSYDELLRLANFANAWEHQRELVIGR